MGNSISAASASSASKSDSNNADLSSAIADLDWLHSEMEFELDNTVEVQTAMGDAEIDSARLITHTSSSSSRSQDEASDVELIWEGIDDEVSRDLLLIC